MQTENAVNFKFGLQAKFAQKLWPNKSSYLFQIIFLGGMTIDSTSTGGFFGFSYSGTWKLAKFDSKENAYSLCSFMGQVLFS